MRAPYGQLPWCQLSRRRQPSTNTSRCSLRLRASSSPGSRPAHQPIGCARASPPRDRSRNAFPVPYAPRCVTTLALQQVATATANSSISSAAQSKNTLHLSGLLNEFAVEIPCFPAAAPDQDGRVFFPPRFGLP